MNYRCPKCSHRLDVRTLFFRDISTCARCGQKVVLGDFLAFFLAAVAMLVLALTVLYVLSHELDEYLVAAAYSVSAGMLAGLAVLLLLGRATPFRRVRSRRRRGVGAVAPKP
jgi:DNA-directed RNA polymerase subunit RPC12/RpoP